MKFRKLAVALAAAGCASGAYATDGMNLEGYGPIATGMGGASMAYDNGTAAMMNNPATLSLMADGSNRLDIALGNLGPDVSMHAAFPGAPVTQSGGDSYYMPAVGWARKSGQLTYGLGLFAQGGMGTEWDDAVFNSMYSADGLPQRSELGVGRLMAPLAFDVNNKFTIAGSLDFVWAMLDIKMAMPLANMFSMVTGMTGNLATAMMDFYTYYDGGEGTTPVRIDFSDGSDYTGEAQGYGMAGKIGFIYKATPTVTIGGTYHTKTALGDLETDADGAQFVLDGGVAGTVPGKITVEDFQWPATAALGVAVQATPSLLIAADLKYIGWEDVMKDFKMTFSTTVPGFDGTASFALPQNWEDQTVLKLGVAYKATPALTLRAGASFADNPIPDATMNYLFPAIVKNHYTGGFGYAFSPSSELNFSLTYAPEVTQTNPSMGLTVDHSQTNWQLMYSARF